MKKTLTPDDMLQKALVTPSHAPSVEPAPKVSNTTIPAKKKALPHPAVTPAVLPLKELNSFQEVSAAVHQIKISAQRELEATRKMRNDAHRYQMETAIRARSDAQQLILRTRLATQRETEELLRQASEEIQKVLADIRMIRIMAQEELAAQRKFTDAAKLRSMSFAIQGSAENSEPKKKRQLSAVK